MQLFLEQIYYAIPDKVKLVSDVVMIPTGIVAGLGTMFGLFATLMGGLASFAAFTYTVVRIYFFLKDRKAGK